MILTKTAQLVPDLSWYVTNNIPMNINVLSLSEDDGAVITLPEIDSLNELPLNFVITINPESDSSIVITPFGSDTINGSADDIILESTTLGYLTVQWLGNGNDWTIQASPVVPPYKVYTAVLTQLSTNAPSVTVLQNTLGATLNFTYVDEGAYLVSASSAVFTNKRTTIEFGGNFNTFNSDASFVQSWGLDTSQFNISTLNQSGVYKNEILEATMIEIRVYN